MLRSIFATRMRKLKTKNLAWFKAVGVAALVTVACGQATLASADQKEVLYDVYTLSASAQSDVKNDLMTVNMVVQAEGSNAADVADSINATMGWAVARLKPFSTIRTETLDYRTNP